MIESNIFHWVVLEGEGGVLAKREEGVVGGISTRVRVGGGVICESKSLFVSQYLLECHDVMLFT